MPPPAANRQNPSRAAFAASGSERALRTKNPRTNSRLAPAAFSALRAENRLPAPRTARFVSAVALARPGQPTRICRGTCEGTVGFAPRGNNGFGYDPYFTPLGMDKTFAELPAEVKNGMSHRAHALAALRRSLEEEG